MKRRGMTLVELMMVVAVVGSLASLAVPNFIEAVRKARRVEQTAAIEHIEQAVKVRFAEGPLNPGSYFGSWNPVLPPAGFDSGAPGWRDFSIAFDGSQRFSYQLDVTVGLAPGMLVTVREDLGGRYSYRTREWELCDGWNLLSDRRDGVDLLVPVPACARATPPSAPVASAPPSTPPAPSAPSASAPPAAPATPAAPAAPAAPASPAAPVASAPATPSTPPSSPAAPSSSSSGSSSSGNSNGNGNNGHHYGWSNGNNGNGNDHDGEEADEKDDHDDKKDKD